MKKMNLNPKKIIFFCASLSIINACAATPNQPFASQVQQNKLGLGDAKNNMNDIDNINLQIQAVEAKLAENQRAMPASKMADDAVNLTNGHRTTQYETLEDQTQVDYAEDSIATGLEGVESEENINKTTTKGGEQPDNDNSKKNQAHEETPQYLLDKVAPAYPVFDNLTDTYAHEVNNATWYRGMPVNPYTTVKLQILLDWNHASPGPIDKGWGMNSKKALRAFEYKHGFEVDGRMDDAVWEKLTEGGLDNYPVLVGYRITKADVKGPYLATPRGYEAKSKMRRMSYQNIREMLAERFHMNINFLRQLNPNSEFKAGDEIIVVNVGKHNTTPITRVVADKRSEMLYAYGEDDTLVATYPTTVGSRKTPSPNGTHKVVAKVYMPYYGATSKSDPQQKWTLPPGPNNPVGTVWLALSKRSYGIHGSPKPEGISRQASAGCVRLTNWDAAELYATIKKGAMVEFR